MVIYGAAGLTARAQAYDLLTRAAAEHWGLQGLPALARGERGKPFFPGLTGREFNLSHSGDVALCVLDEGPVGVDVQKVKVWRDSLPRRVCSPEERAWLGEDTDFWERFAQLWALKESRAKYAGAGLTRPISSIRVPLPGPEEDLMELDGLWFRTYAGTDWRGAACGQTPPPKTVRWVVL